MMRHRFLGTLHTFRARFRERAFLLGAAPAIVLVLLLAVKMLYIGLDHGETLDEAWYPFTPRRAVQSGVANLALLLVLLAPVWLLRPVWRLAAVWGVNLVLTLLVLADAVHLRFFGDLIAVSAAGDARQLTLVRDSVVALLEPIDLFLFVDLAAVLVLLPLYVRAVRGCPELAGRPSARPALHTLALGAALLVLVPVPLMAVDKGDILRYDHRRFAGARKIGVLNYHLYAGARHFYREVIAPHNISEADRAHVRAFVDGWRGNATAPSARFGAARGKNLILLMVESLHAFPLGMRIGGREVTPNLNALAARSMSFKNFYGQTWDGSTSDGEFTSLQSLHPLRVGAVANTYPGHGYRGIPRVLAERGYSTVSAHALDGALWNMQGMHRRLGFQQSFFREDFAPGEFIGLGLGDRDFLRQVMPVLVGQRRPFAAYVMTLTSHHPYPLPARHKELEVGPLEGTLLGGYLHTVHYTDAAIGEFVRGLEKNGLLDESLLVVYGDHRANIGPSKDLETLLTRHAGYPVRARGFDARYWREENRLPLLIHLPGDSAAGVYTGSAGHLDIAPTVLNLLGVANHGMVTLGRDLTQGVSSQVVLRDGSFILGDTLCSTPTASAAGAHCGNGRTGEPLDPSRFAARFAVGAERLRVSDMIIMADMIPSLTARAGAPVAAGPASR